MLKKIRKSVLKGSSERENAAFTDLNGVIPTRKAFFTNVETIFFDFHSCLPKRQIASPTVENLVETSSKTVDNRRTNTNAENQNVNFC